MNGVNPSKSTLGAGFRSSTQPTVLWDTGQLGSAEGVIWRSGEDVEELAGAMQPKIVADLEGLPTIA